MIKYLVAYGLINLITGLLVVDYATLNQNNKDTTTIPCDSCRFLYRKDYKKGKYKYDCNKRQSKFCNPPLMCGNYKERPVETIEGNWKML